MKLFGTLLNSVLVVGILCSTLLLAAESGYDLFQKGLAKERAEADYGGAIKLYERVTKEHANERKLAAEAMFRIGACQQALGLPEARSTFERVVKEYASDQPDIAAQAKTRIAVADGGSVAGFALHRVWSGPDVSTAEAISPDGRYLVLNKDRDLVVRNLVGGETRSIARLSTDNDGDPVWSLDSKRIAYTDNGQVNVVNSDGTGVRRTIYRYTEDTRTAVAAWSPDRTRLLVTTVNKSDSPRLSRFSWIGIADGAVQPIPVHAASPAGNSFISPDGKFILFRGVASDPEGQPEFRLYLMGSDGTGETKLSDAFPVGWTPDGKYFLSTHYQAGGALDLWKTTFVGGKIQGLPVAVTTDFQADRVQFLGLTLGGTLYYSRETGRSDIYTASMDPITGKVTSLPEAVPVSRTGYNVLPRWSPDGRRILYYELPRTPRRTRTRELSIYAFDKKKDQRVPFASFGGRGTCWTADGESILVSQTNGVSSGEQYVPIRLDLATQKATTLFTGDTSFGISSCIDGLLVTSDQSGIKVRNLKTGAESTPYRGQVTSGTILSHDGRSIQFKAPIDAISSATFVVPTAGGPATELKRDVTADLQQNYGAAWSPDDRFVYLLRKSDRTADYELFRMPATGGAEVSTGLKLPDLRDIDISPDGTRIAFSIGAVTYPEIWAMENFLPSEHEASGR